MASNAKRSRSSSTFTLDEVIAFVQETDDEYYSDSDSGGLTSGEESEIDRKLQNFDEESSNDEEEDVPPPEDFDLPDQNRTQDGQFEDNESGSSDEDNGGNDQDDMINRVVGGQGNHPVRGRGNTSC
ncbi:acidic leucine-rich nuclear phosphoprotein 32 family member B-like isoform X2 [Exaiptasia diaphana]|uniref:Uncharacterized protein n=1 Tax=Exaiptasia diaphana TaxID=2652724 RepID=A0A913YJW3_EXADI|nr:acidic leucine-rich nuclear phosphoprotein 32 family member B-like isoform X2 [Exaiptasia diaphana]